MFNFRLCSKSVFSFFSLLLMVAAFALNAQAATFTVTKIADTNDGVCDKDCSLREAIGTANAAATDDIIGFDATAFASARTIILSAGQLQVENKGSLTIIGSSSLTISGNNASRVFIVYESASLTLNNLRITQGKDTFGGGILSQSFTTLNINSTFIDNNTATVSGGGIYKQLLGSINVRLSTVSNNRAIEGFGGGVVSECNNGTFSNVVISSNSSGSSGGGMYGDGESKTDFNNVTINNNAALTSGGGIFINIPSTVNFTDSTIRNNSAGIGAGIRNDGTLTINKSTVSDNSAQSGDGGGISNRGIGNLTNATVSGNRAVNGTGGGISNVSGGVLTVVNITTSNNAANRGGGVSVLSGNFNSRNSIYGDNTASSGISPDFSGTIISDGYNLIENTDGALITGAVTGNILGQDPQLLPLNNYGGATQTVSLQPFSPAIDKADPNNFPETDQRGIVRPQDGEPDTSPLPDIGAYERRVTTFNVTKTSDTNDGVCNTDCSLREAIAALATANVPDKVILFDPVTFAAPQTINLTGGQLLIPENTIIAIKGIGKNLLTISGDGTSSVIGISPRSVVAISGLTVIKGNNGILSTGGILTINDSIIKSNKGYGGIYSVGTLLTLNNSIVTENISTDKGAGILGVTMTINNSVISNNVSDRDGGGVYCAGGDMTVNNSIVSGNSLNPDITFSIRGGGIYFSGNTLRLNNSTVAGNRAPGDAGGGIYNRNQAYLVNSTVNNNSAVAGGGIFNSNSGVLTAVNSTVSGNTAGLDGGGIGNAETANAIINLINTTVANNTAARDGGGIFNNFDGKLSVQNSIIAGNISASLGKDIKGKVFSQDYNLIENTGDVTITGAITNNIYGQAPGLLPLGNYGGNTQTHALRSTSPAVDKGNSVVSAATDQRGLGRPFDFPSIPNAAGGNGSDIGAFERQNADVNRNTFFDYDGDGQADISLFRPSDRVWYILNSGGIGVSYTQFGLATDKIVPADYDGDGKTDIAVFRPETGVWFIMKSSGGVQFTQFGAAEDIPQPRDFNGDGKADIAVFRPSTGVWFILSADTTSSTATQFGASEDKPVAGDYDGDGKAEIAVYRPSLGVWFLYNSITRQTSATRFGISTDKPVPADYDGDGKTDIAVYRPADGNWYLLQSRDGYTVAKFGLATDQPTPADFDGDGKTDIAVYRPSEGNWYSLQSKNGFSVTKFGLETDKPTPNAFVY